MASRRSRSARARAAAIERERAAYRARLKARTAVMRGDGPVLVFEPVEVFPSATEQRARDRLERHERRVAAYRAHYARLGVPISDAVLLTLARQEPLNLSAGLHGDDDDEED